ncbi:MAG: metal-dependent hydrolase [Planctomycetota bacterium]
MADFHTHVTVSSVLGAGYSVAGMVAGMHPSTALVAGGLCGVAGMLPDVDSDSGIPRREAMGFTAAIVPMLLVDRFDQLHLGHDQMVLMAAVIYFLIRFVAADLVGKFSVHRGMWHSIPAVLIFAGIAFLVAGPADDLTVRYFKAFAVGLGAMSHLVLDEVYSVDTRGVVPKFKKSFGTAVKLYSKSPWANFSTYAKLAVVVAAIAAEPSVLAQIEVANPALAGRIRGYRERFDRQPNDQSPYPAPGVTAQPQATQPNYQQPSYQQPGYQQPSYQQPSYQQPSYQQPSYQPPGYRQPGYSQPPAGSFPQPAANPFPQPTSGYQGQPAAAMAPAPSIRRQ